MALDPARIRTLEQAVTTARRAVAEADITSRPAAEVARARADADLQAAWAAHRAEELASADELLAAASTTDVLGLFPIGLEAKLEPALHRLRLRVWPEAVTRSTHDPALTGTEEAAGRRYWIADAAADDDAAHRAAWEALAVTLGPQRAAWAAHVLTPTNLGDLADGRAAVFPEVEQEDPANPFVPTAAVLPDRWLVLGYRDGAQVLVHVGPPITHPLVAGLDLTAAAVAAAPNATGRPIRLPPRMRWMADFDAAVAAGMAMEIPVPGELDQLDQLYVIGIREGGPAAGREEVERLLTGHRYGRGLAFVAQGTPTNNSPSGGSGLPSPTEAIAQAYAHERTSRTYGEARSNGQQLAGALGIAPETVANAPLSGAVANIDAEPDGFEPDVARAMRTMLWMPVLGHFLEDLAGFDQSDVEAMRDHFLHHVSAAGPVPAIRVGDQPYGVLPVTALHTFTEMPGEGVDPMLVQVLRTIPRISETTRLDTDRAEDLLNFTATPRTFLESSMAPGTPFWTEFVGNAGWLNEQSGGAIPENWAQGALKDLEGDWDYPDGHSLFTIDELPPRPLADDGTPAALGALATMPPGAIRADTTDASTLTRVARYTTLQEWARFARAVGEAALDGTSFLDGARAAAATNRALWLDLLQHAFDPAAGGPPFPVASDTADKIRTLVGSLDTPSGSSPGQPRLASFRAALHLLGQVPVAQLQSAAYPTLALSHVREDAWQTSLATRRLATLREANPSGLVVGGFGWLLDVRAATLLPPFAAEFIHAPSHDQAAAAAVLRSAAVRAGNAGSGHADIDLSSKRVRLAHWLIDGVRAGRPLTELLGARFERRLVEAGGGELLAQLRRDYPGPPGSGSLDGLALRAAPPPIADPAFADAMAELNGSFDALADAITAEAVYQLVRGNPTGAIVDLDDVVRGGAPPPLEVTRSPMLGTTLSHRVAAVVPADRPAPGWPAVHTPRADADPLLDAWCGHVLGPAAATVVHIDGTDAGGAPLSIPVGLDGLGVGALDVVVATADGGAELMQRLLARARALRPQLSGGVVRSDPAWKDLLRVGARIERLLARAEPLTPDALTMPGAPPAPSDGDGDGDLPARVTAARSRLEALRDALVPAGATASLVREAAGFGIVLPGVALDAPPSSDQQLMLAAGVDDRLATAASRPESRDRLRVLVAGVLGLVAVTPPDPDVLATAATPPSASFAVDPATCAGWVEAMGRVRPALSHLADVMAMVEISGRSAAPPLRIAQAPWAADDPWIGVGGTNPRTRAPASGRLSLVLHAPAGVDPVEALGGFLVDAWTDAVPSSVRDTGLAVRNNGPNTRAPQTLLLAVAPDTSAPTWTADALVACLRDTIDAVVLRQGILFLYRPLTFLGRRADGAGISYDGAEPPT